MAVSRRSDLGPLPGASGDRIPSIEVWSGALRWDRGVSRPAAAQLMASSRVVRKDGNMVTMKTTLEVPDELYRQVKAKSALEGRTVKDVVVELFRAWLEAEPASVRSAEAEDSPPSWFGSLGDMRPVG